jgi:mercuric ion transport protein
MTIDRILSGLFATLGLISGTVAVLAASCCVLPLALAGLGAGAGIFSALEILVEYQKPLLALSAALVAAAWLLYFRRPGATRTAVALTVATLLVGSAAAWGHIEGHLLEVVRANR